MGWELWGLLGVEGLDTRICWGFRGWATAIFLFRPWAMDYGSGLQPSGNWMGRNPGAAPQAGMERAFGAYRAAARHPTHRDSAAMDGAPVIPPIA
jgi:hypothetical protein